LRIDVGTWARASPIFELLRGIGSHPPKDDWRRTFNLGIGMIFVVSPPRILSQSQAYSQNVEGIATNEIVRP